MRKSGFRPRTIAEVARRASINAQRFDSSVREFIDSLEGLSRVERAAALAEEPAPVGNVEDAYLAALAEHLSSADGADAPAWTEDQSRFLKAPFFAGGLQSLKASLLVESPSAFRRRLIFISSDGLSRPPRTSARGQDGRARATVSR